ncbi:C-terminal binding protein [Cryobacterium psychrophilum]|uniref:C-terminal binding protein n=1 Tax=Cryobacterium psychrophilum TaxID=41988 RepID=A0A4Y8KN78_9MICO|nr:C-terminal binding protein [Cryobacterium psychrophilum]TDW30481.1 D-3-phosphoglycerate dehydrogenase [Cryobacterium psychrophilum]TFD79554.1 C-terminal binding protein [Cryobacterium psychrophilum]
MAVPERKPLAIYTDNEDIDPTPGIRLLEQSGFEVRFLETLDPDRILAEAQGAQALLVGYAPIPERVIAGLPDLRVISLISMGFDHIDLDAARAAGVWVTNLPGVASEEVATHALGLILATVRDLPFFERVIGIDWNARPAVTPPRLSQKTLGLMGLGRIGAKLAEFASPLFGQIVGYDPYVAQNQEAAAHLESLGVRLAGLDEVLASADVLSLHLPLTPETHHVINAESISRMKPGSYLINVSRGQLIDTTALVEALDSGQITAAGLDVLDTEPAPPDHPLITHDRTIVTPHVGFLSEHTLAEYVRIQAQNVISLVRTGEPETLPVVDPR